MKPVTLVLLPGLDGTGELFQPFLDILPASMTPRVVSYPRDHALGYVDLLKNVKRELPVGEDFLIVGESFSGPLAVMVAAEEPKGLIGVVLCASFVKNPFKVLPNWIGVLSVAPIFRLWPATIRLRAMLASGEDRKFAMTALDVINSVEPGVIANRVKGVLTVDVQHQLDDIDVPLLYLAGSHDRLIRGHNVAGIKAARPDLQVAWLDARHFILQQQPQQAANAIEKFLTTNL